MPTLLLIGEKDTTAIGKALAPPEVAKTLGNYAELAPGRPAAHHERHPGGVPRLGHAPHLQDPETFNKALIDQLAQLQSGQVAPRAIHLPPPASHARIRCAQGGWVPFHGLGWRSPTMRLTPSPA